MDRMPVVPAMPRNASCISAFVDVPVFIAIVMNGLPCFPHPDAVADGTKRAAVLLKEEMAIGNR